MVDHREFLAFECPELHTHESTSTLSQRQIQLYPCRPQHHRHRRNDAQDRDRSGSLGLVGSPHMRQVNYGGTVSHNRITRDLTYVPGAGHGLGEGTIGYGYPVGSDIAHWTCLDNVSDPSVIYGGDISGTLPECLNASPGAFVHDRYGNSDSEEPDMGTLRLQPEFIQGKVWGILRIEPGPSKILVYDGGDLI